MIVYQKDKNVNEIMYLMSNKLSRDKYRQSERRLIGIYYFCYFLLMIDFVIYTLQWANITNFKLDLFTDIVVFKTAIIFVILLIVGLILLVLMKNRYNYSYQKQKYSIYAFLLTELLGLFLMTITRFLGWYYGDQLVYFIG